MSRKTSAKEARTMASIRKKLVEPGVPRCPGDKHTMVWVRRNGGPDQLTCCPRCRDGPREAGGIMRLKMTVTNMRTARNRLRLSAALRLREAYEIHPG